MNELACKAAPGELARKLSKKRVAALDDSTPREHSIELGRCLVSAVLKNNKLIERRNAFGYAEVSKTDRPIVVTRTSNDCGMIEVFNVN